MSHSTTLTPYPAWTESALRVLRERYLQKDDSGTVIESPDEMCQRVARAIAQAESLYDNDVQLWAERFYDLIASHRFMPNSPTLANAGKNNGLCLSACFVLPVPDDLMGIFEAIKQTAEIQRAGGGTGFSFSRLRPKGTMTHRTKGQSSGPVSFMRVFNEATNSIAQGGMRRGANMGILRVDHPDIEEFIRCKLDGGITNFNISVAITDAFMHALARGEDYALYDPRDMENPVGYKNAHEVWALICQSAWASGDPGLFFVDRVNATRANPTPALHSIEASNPCGEKPLAPYDVCNLGSINLGLFVTGAHTGDMDFDIDWEGLRQTIQTAVRFLDDVIDVNRYPLPQIEEMAKGNRRIGLGVMGWADMLFKLGIRYDSPEARALADQVMGFISMEADEASHTLGEERGSFPNFDRSIYATPDARALRNANRTTIAPTGTISIIADCSSGIEPLFALAFQHRVKQAEGDYRVLDFVNPEFEQTARLALGDDEHAAAMAYVKAHGSLHGSVWATYPEFKPFVTAHEIAAEDHVLMQAAFQEWSDSGCSKTVNMTNDATVADVAAVYQMAYDTGCIGVTVFRDGCKSEQVLNLGTAAKPPTTASAPQEEPLFADAVRMRPDVMHGFTRRARAPEGTLYVTVNSDSAGEPFEVFMTIGKAGSDVAALGDAIGRLISLHLRTNGPVTPAERLAAVADQLRGIGGASSMGFGPSRTRSMVDALARVLGEFADQTGVAQEDDPAVNLIPSARINGNICDQCGSLAVAHEEGCQKCLACGASKC